MAQSQLNRAQFLKGAAAAGVLATAGPLVIPGQAAAVKRRGLTYRGVCYDAGTLFEPDGESTREVWNSHQIRSEINAIRYGLHCNSVTVLGSDIDRLVEASTIALRRGLHVLIQPRLFDHPQEQVLDHLARTAREAEALRRHKPGVTLVIGCEHMLFLPGLVPGNGFFERVEYLEKHPEEIDALIAKLNRFLRKEIAIVRRHFHGRITYGAAAGLEEIDWSPFDIVGLDYYDFYPTQAEHAKALAPYRRWKKPIMILEFGCCTFVGAPEMGGMGWNVIDFSKDPPEIPDEIVRSERVQAEYLPKMLDVFESLDLYGASIYNFIAPDAPHSPIHKYDMDIPSYSLVKVIRENHSDPRSPYQWQPKRSFHTVARHNLRH